VTLYKSTIFILGTDDIHILRGVGVGVHAVASRCSVVPYEHYQLLIFIGLLIFMT